MRRNASVMGAVFALLLGGIPASAHHGFAVEFDGRSGVWGLEKAGMRSAKRERRATFSAYSA